MLRQVSGMRDLELLTHDFLERGFRHRPRPGSDYQSHRSLYRGDFVVDISLAPTFDAYHTPQWLVEVELPTFTLADVIGDFDLVASSVGVFLKRNSAAPLFGDVEFFVHPEFVPPSLLKQQLLISRPATNLYEACRTAARAASYKYRLPLVRDATPAADEPAQEQLAEWLSVSSLATKHASSAKSASTPTRTSRGTTCCWPTLSRAA